MEIGTAIRQSASPVDVVRPGRSAPSAVHAPAAAPPPPNAVSTESASSKPPAEVVDALAARVAANTRTGSRIRVDEATDRVVVQILNAENEVIKQLPPEDLLRVLERFREVTGLIFDRQI
jgi:uncharacterized FlaG/YvyC family protein